MTPVDQSQKHIIASIKAIVGLCNQAQVTRLQHLTQPLPPVLRDKGLHVMEDYQKLMTFDPFLDLNAAGKPSSNPREPEPKLRREKPVFLQQQHEKKPTTHVRDIDKKSFSDADNPADTLRSKSKRTEQAQDHKQKTKRKADITGQLQKSKEKTPTLKEDLLASSKSKQHVASQSEKAQSGLKQSADHFPRNSVKSEKKTPRELISQQRKRIAQDGFKKDFKRAPDKDFESAETFIASLLSSKGETESQKVTTQHVKDKFLSSLITSKQKTKEPTINNSTEATEDRAVRADNQTPVEHNRSNSERNLSRATTDLEDSRRTALNERANTATDQRPTPWLDEDISVQLEEAAYLRGYDRT